MSIRQQIIDALGAALSGITQANGYQTDVGGNTFEWREKLALDRLPAVIYRDMVGEIDFDEVPMGFQDNILTVEIEAAAAGATSLAEARAMLADIARCVYQNRKLGGLARWSGAKRAEILCDHQEQIITGAKVTAEIVYRTEIGII